MEIRKDFESAATYLHRLWAIGREFADLNNERWPHMKNKEDFRRVETMEHPRRTILEDLYGTGRDIAIYMSWHLRAFNEVGEFPTMTSYVNTFASNWCAQVPQLQERTEVFKVHAAAKDTPWAVRQMLEMWQQQIELLEAVNSTVTLLKQSDIYRLENGEIKVSDLSKQSVNIGVIGNVHGSKVNVGSADSSTTINISTHQVFTSIRESLAAAAISDREKEGLKQHVDAMEASVGKPSFTARYQDFITAAANHMTIIAPFLPALSKLLGVPLG